jgi:hypothetical protein
VLIVFVGSSLVEAAQPAPGKERWSTTLAQYLAGCASERTRNPTFNLTSGVGHWQATAHATTCPQSRGGRSTTSEAQLSTVLLVTLPVRIRSQSTGVEVAWSLVLNVTTSALTKAPAFQCPQTYYNYSYFDAFYNYTYLYRYVGADCSLESSVGFTGSSDLEDVTTGSTFFGSAWAGVSNTSGLTVDYYRYTTNYSGNRSFWSSNSTVSASYNASWGPSTSLVLSEAPAWWINGTYVPTDRYVVQTEVDVAVMTEVVGYPKASASATVDARSAGDHLDLTLVRVR